MSCRDISRIGFLSFVLSPLVFLVANGQGVSGDPAPHDHTSDGLQGGPSEDDDLLLDDVVSVDDTSLTTSIDTDIAAEDAVNLGIGLNYESQYVSRGKQIGYEVYQTSIAVSYLGLTAGMWSNFPLDSSINDDDVEEFDFTLSYGFSATDGLNITVGGLLEYYPNQLADPRTVWGLSFAAELDSIFASPTFLYQYKFERERHELYFILNHEIDLEPYFGYSGAFVVLGGNFGYADQGDTSFGDKNSWAWAMGRVNLGHTFYDEQLRVLIGPQIATNNDGASRNIGGRETNVWMNISAVISF
ncbi:MAG: hypothetical protein AAGJ81_08465 [Verrucomicrobiota bacterium]